MDKRITEIMELVCEINRKGGALAFNLSDHGFQVHDTANGCNDILSKTEYHHTVLYFAEWFKDKYEICIVMYLEELKERLAKC